MKKIKVGTIEDLKKNNQFSKWIDDHDVLVFFHNNKIRAFSNICPHFGGPIGYHEIKKNKSGDNVFTCLWHNLEFKVEDGKCVQHKNLELREYDVLVEGDDILVYLN